MNCCGQWLGHPTFQVGRKIKTQKDLCCSWTFTNSSQLHKEINQVWLSCRQILFKCIPFPWEMQMKKLQPPMKRNKTSHRELLCHIVTNHNNNHRLFHGCKKKLLTFSLGVAIFIQIYSSFNARMMQSFANVFFSSSSSSLWETPRNISRHPFIIYKAQFTKEKYFYCQDAKKRRSQTVIGQVIYDWWFWLDQIGSERAYKTVSFGKTWPHNKWIR